MDESSIRSPRLWSQMWFYKCEFWISIMLECSAKLPEPELVIVILSKYFGIFSADDL